MLRLFFITLLLLMPIPYQVQAGAPELVRYLYYPGRSDYSIELIQHVLNLTESEYGPAVVQKIPHHTIKVRSEVALLTKLIDVAGFTPNNKRKNVLIRIPTPLTQGMLGYRLLLVTPESEKKLAGQLSLADFQQRLLGGVAIRWDDFRLFNHNKVLVSTSMSYQPLVEMLSSGKIDYFARGLNEIFRELKEQKEAYPNLRITPNVALYYPFDFYFHVNNSNTKLAQRLSKGLAQAEQDGSFQRLFQHHFKEQISQLQRLQPKQIIYLEHPNQPYHETFHYDWWLSGQPPVPE